MLSWAPVLDPKQIGVARQLLRELARGLREPVVAQREPALIALFLGYFAVASDDAELADAAVSVLAHAAEDLSSVTESGPGFLRRAVPVAWVIEHFRNELSWESDGDPTDLLDAILEAQINESASDLPLGLVDGISGLAVYFLERPRTPAVASILERILLHLAETQASRMGLGTTWWTHPLFISDELRPTRPFGHYDLGVANGVPGILGILGQTACAGIAHSVAVGMWRRGIRWLLSKRLDVAGFPLPEFCGTNVRSTVGPETWQYGSISAGAVLHHASLAMGDVERATELLDWLRVASTRPMQEQDPVGPALCAGTAGLGHIYNRLYHRSGDSLFAEQARFWLHRSLESLGRSAFRSFGQRSGDAMTGLAGSALAILAATVDQEPVWDRFMLLSSPPSVRDVHDIA